MTQIKDDKQAVAQAERAMAAAHVTLDLDAIDALLHPDYVIVQPGGVVEGKAEVLASYASGTRHWDVAAVSDLDVRIYGDSAVVIGVWRGIGRNNTTNFDYQARFNSVWLRDETGTWRNIVSQSAEM